MHFYITKQLNLPVHTLVTLQTMINMNVTYYSSVGHIIVDLFEQPKMSAKFGFWCMDPQAEGY